MNANTNTFSDSNLTQGKTYYYRVYAFNGNNSSEKAEQSAEIQLPRYSLNLFSFNNSGDASWIRENSSQAFSGRITHNQKTCIFKNVHFREIYFEWKVSSERNYDFLRFYINGVQLHRISGSVNWTNKSYSFINSQSREVKWCYTKDYSVSGNSDRAWIRNFAYN